MPTPRRTAERIEKTPIRRRAFNRLGALGTVLTEQPVSLYAAAALRIGYGLFFLTFLLAEFPHRDEIWGPGSPWTPALANQLFEQTGWVSILTLSESRVYFEVCYIAAVLTSALFMLGWRTRATSILFAIMMASFYSRAIYMTDGGDNLVALLTIYLIFTACGRRWSLDARRIRLRARVRRSSGWGLARQTLTTVLHNCAMFIIAAQVCILYGCAGFYKVQGGTWGNGTALHYVLNQELFQPWPSLSFFVDSHPLLVTGACYMTVLLQVAFPFVLFSRLKYVVLVMLLSMHLCIAVLMGLPFFSAAMIIADAVFLPDRFYLFIARVWRQSRTANWLGRQLASRTRWRKRSAPMPLHPSSQADEALAKPHADDSTTAGV